MKFETAYSVATMAASARLSQRTVFHVTIRNAPMRFVHQRNTQLQTFWTDENLKFLADVDVIVDAKQEMRMACGPNIPETAQLWQRSVIRKHCDEADYFVL